MGWTAIVEQVKPYHGLQDPDVELPAILDAFGQTAQCTFLEIGTYQGGTSAAVALGYPDAEVLTIDLPEPETALCNPQPARLQGIAFRLLCPDRVTQITMDSADLEILCAEPPLIGRRFDMVFVDGDHREERALGDLRSAATVLRSSGAILVHDYTDESDGDSRPHWTRWVHAAVHRFAVEQRFSVERLAGWLARLRPLGSGRSDP